MNWQRKQKNIEASILTKLFEIAQSPNNLGKNLKFSKISGWFHLFIYLNSKKKEKKIFVI